MSDKEIKDFVEVLYPFIKKKLLDEGFLKNYMRVTNATVVSELASGATNIDKEVEVVLPYDTTSFSAINYSGKNLNKNDLVSIAYWVDLKNSVVLFKSN